MDYGVRLPFAFVSGDIADRIGAGDSPQVTLALPSVDITFTALYLAEDLHLLADQGLDVKTMVIPGVGTNNAVINGSVRIRHRLIRRDHARIGAIRPAYAGDRRRRQKDHGMGDAPQGRCRRRALRFRARRSRNARKILKGRKIAVTGIGSLPDAVLRSVAAEAGIHADDMQISTMLPPEIMAAWKTKQIEGFPTRCPTRSR